MARPTKYKPEYAAVAAQAVREFKATKAQLAALFSVTRETVNDWAKNNQEFSDAIKDAGEELDQQVEESLIRRAMGYSHEAEKIFLDREGNVVRAAYTEHYPPDATSMIFWLKNRQPGKWRDKQETELSGSVTVTPIFEVNVKGGK